MNMYCLSHLFLSQGWLTLGRAQLNLGEVSMAIESLEKVSLPEASEDLQMARKLLIQTSSKSNDNF